MRNRIYDLKENSVKNWKISSLHVKRGKSYKGTAKQPLFFVFVFLFLNKKIFIGLYLFYFCFFHFLVFFWVVLLVFSSSTKQPFDKRLICPVLGIRTK